MAVMTRETDIRISRNDERSKHSKTVTNSCFTISYVHDNITLTPQFRSRTYHIANHAWSSKKVTFPLSPHAYQSWGLFVHPLLYVWLCVLSLQLQIPFKWQVNRSVSTKIRTFPSPNRCACCLRQVMTTRKKCSMVFPNYQVHLFIDLVKRSSFLCIIITLPSFSLLLSSCYS